MEIHLGEQKLKNIWVKVTGMLQQNWAFIDADRNYRFSLSKVFECAHR